MAKRRFSWRLKATKDLHVTHLFVLDPGYENHNYLDNHALSLTLLGGDALFKLESAKQFSVITADQREFLYLKTTGSSVITVR